MFRVDPYWFADNADNPAERFYPALVARCCASNGIPFRLHWGKFQPIYARGDRDVGRLLPLAVPALGRLPRLRAERDPNNIFLTDYWRDRFGLWDERDSPQARSSVGTRRVRRRV